MKKFIRFIQTAGAIVLSVFLFLLVIGMMFAPTGNPDLPGGDSWMANVILFLLIPVVTVLIGPLIILGLGYMIGGWWGVGIASIIYVGGMVLDISQDLSYKLGEKRA